MADVCPWPVHCTAGHHLAESVERNLAGSVGTFLNLQVRQTISSLEKQLFIPSSYNLGAHMAPKSPL